MDKKKSENLEIWNLVKQPPPQMLKTITAGRLKGKSDINPQWRMQILTEIYGPIGTGWNYTIDKLWTESGIDGQIFAFAQISLHIGSATSPIPGIGGSMLIVKEEKGLHHNDEAYKMAVTDALSVAMKALGVGADVYQGRWNGSKYVETANDAWLEENPKQESQKTSILWEDKRNEIAFTQGSHANISWANLDKEALIDYLGRNKFFSNFAARELLFRFGEAFETLGNKSLFDNILKARDVDLNNAKVEQYNQAAHQLTEEYKILKAAKDEYEKEHSKQNKMPFKNQWTQAH